MRLYHYTTAPYALDDIQRRRIKIAEYKDCNDPFELGCYVGNRKNRLALRLSKNEIHKKFGFVSFCLDWHNTVLWSHYADKHKGICLGFDLRQRAFAHPVWYPRCRPHFPAKPDVKTVETLLFTKSPGWAYEKEWRASVQLDERDAATQLYFRGFDDNFRLREVIVGASADDDLSEEKIRAILGDYPYRVLIKKARLGFKRFEVVTQRKGFATSMEHYPESLKQKFSDEVLRAATEVGYQTSR